MLSADRDVLTHSECSFWVTMSPASYCPYSETQAEKDPDHWNPTGAYGEDVGMKPIMHTCDRLLPRINTH